MSKTIFRYPGGKSKKSIRNLILSYAPKSYTEYREPFVGGGGIFFSIDPNTIRWINDINENLISVYLALRDRPADFISKCRQIRPSKSNEAKAYPKPGSKGKKYNKRLLDQFKLLCKDKSDPALSYFFINRTVWAGRVNYTQQSRLYFSNPNGWNIVKTNKLEMAAKVVINTKITSGHYHDLLNQDGKNVWIYCDPPYFSDSERNNMSQLYEYSFDRNDHQKFINTVANCKHKVLISYDDHPEINKMAKSANLFINKHTWTYCGNSKLEKDIGKELIITNYKTDIKQCSTFV